MTPAWYPWAGPAILTAIGMFLIVMSYGALIQSKRTGRHISGIPFFGGLFVYSLLSERFKRDKKD